MTMVTSDEGGLYGFLQRTVQAHAAECAELPAANRPRVAHILLGYGAMADLVESLPPGALRDGNSSRDGVVRYHGLVYETERGVNRFQVRLFSGNARDGKPPLYCFLDARPFYQ